MKKVFETWNTRCQLQNATWKLAFESLYAKDKRSGVVKTSGWDRGNKSAFWVFLGCFFFFFIGAVV